ncbi:RNA polymerase sigma factor [Saccharibacillus sp. CPCC 101409]|uniref:RNA polymerase sigma factor n=1 Tax=Saccharibacillus sp. CPCC 101409 TaxID=3058041 RepID=UPI0026725CA4|nr:RNA polymerase sigma factor [Saccharibacillus sp. CPCC 101409]MDO3411774.1 RNA polymerase sigma factor [Saccharibacillus sp. CPCC 101409]
MENHSNGDDAEVEPILVRVRQGDKEAYARIIERFQRPIFLYGYYMLRSRQEAEDAAQETFLKAYRSIGQFTPTHSFSAWLYKIAKNVCLDELRKRKKRLDLFAFYRDRQHEQQHPSYGDLIHDVLDKLTEAEKQILLLRSLEEYSYDEIAFILDSKPAAIRKKYERIRKKLIKEKKQGVNIYEHTYPADRKA